MRAQPLNISSSFGEIKYSSKAVDCISTNYMFSTLLICRDGQTSLLTSVVYHDAIPPRIPIGEYWMHGKLNSKARTGLSFCKRRVSCCPYSVLEEGDAVHKKKRFPPPLKQGNTWQLWECMLQPYGHTDLRGFQFWDVESRISIKLACLTTPKSIGLPSPRLFLSDTSTLNWSLICVHYQRHIRAERKWWKKELQIDCSTPRQSCPSTPKELSSLLRGRRTPFNALHP